MLLNRHTTNDFFRNVSIYGRITSVGKSQTKVIFLIIKYSWLKE